MKRGVFIILLSFIFLAGNSQQLSASEYFFDTDPGVGLATPISITANDTVNFIADIPVSSLSNGFHQLYIRAKDVNGKWGIAEQRPFYKDGSANLSVSNLVSSEYFFDTDPGVGLATPISITANDTVNFIADIPVSSLSNGFHQLYIRAKDVNGKWGIAEQRPFYKDGSANLSVSNLVSSEYFFDTDPGVGLATPISITANDTVNFIADIPVSSLSNGFHQLCIRAKDVNGKWGIAEQRPFYVDAGLQTSMPPIVAAEYFISSDSGVTRGTPIAVVKGDSLNTDFNINPVNLPLGNYTLNVRVQDSLGRWSIAEARKFTICETYGSSADFYYASTSTDISFLNNSQYATRNHWIFGDGDTSNLVNPFHHFLPGVYNVCLVTSNGCVPAGDTLCKQISVYGMKSISPNEIANKGVYSLVVEGAGFGNMRKFQLTRQGQINLLPDSIIKIDNSKFYAKFTLDGNAQNGAWTPEIIFINGDTSRLINSLQLSSVETPKLNVKVSGDGVLRVGFSQVYTLTVSNDGSTDAYFPSLFIDGLPAGTRFEFPSDSLLGGKNIPDFNSLGINWDSTDNELHVDSSNMTSFTWLTIYKVPAHSVNAIKVIFHIPDNTVLHSYNSIRAFITGPLFNSADMVTGQYRPSDLVEGLTSADCIDQLLTLAEENAFKELAIPGTLLSCIGNTIITSRKIYKTMKTIGDSSTSITKKGLLLFKAPGIVKGIATTTLDCLVAGGFSAISWPIYVALVLKKYKEAFDFVSDLSSILSIAQNCFDNKSVKKEDESKQSVIIGNAWDPNEKFGPGSNSSSHYVNTDEPYSYTIAFENSPNANLSAQTVTIIDTIDKTKFDLSSFSFTSVTIGKSTFNLQNTSKSFIHDFDFISAMGVKARVTAIADTTNGLVKCIFNTIDPATNQNTLNALSGFLPPDINSPEGQGYLTYSIKPKQSVNTGDTLKNSAEIIFDYNPAIVTNNWQCLIDLVAPSSMVQPLKAITNNEKFVVKWGGSDNLSGIESYDIYVSVNDSTFRPWLSGTDKIVDTFPGVFGSKYAFYSIAIDSASNKEPNKSSFETVTLVSKLKTDSICKGTSISFGSGMPNNGNTYQWQVDTSGVFVNLVASAIYSNVNADTLNLDGPPAYYAGYKYRCIVTNGGINDTTVAHELHFKNEWTGASNSEWNNISNWSCNSLPDRYTDVIVKTGLANYPVVSSNVDCRSLNVKKAASIIVNSGFNINIVKPSQ